MDFVMEQHFVPINKETLEDMKYQSEKMFFSDRIFRCKYGLFIN